MNTSSTDFLVKHDFLLRRLHSLSGLIPVGAYMVVHLVVNASLLNGPATYQNLVNQIHSLGAALPIVEWTFIFIPIIFHAALGFWIISTGRSNTDQYRYVNNWRYTMQRVTGMIAFVYIFLHVFHLHGWFQNDWWFANVAEPLGMAQFRPYNAASTLSAAMSGYVWPLFYFVGITASVFHFANGIWTMGITWGVWTSPRAQRTATYVCAAGGTLLLLVGLAALIAPIQTDVDEARAIEDAMYESRVLAREIEPDRHKRALPAGAEGTTDAHGGGH
jgi:succinate dehydrogenase / fumarate reductase, cytochrome b subunit